MNLKERMKASLLPTHDFTYLATPYTWAGKGRAIVEEARWQGACNVAAWLMEGGQNVYCPIAHGHTIASYMSAKSMEWWLDQDLPFLNAARSLTVAELPGFRDSRGVRWEIEHMATIKRRVVHIPERVLRDRFTDHHWKKMSGVLI